MQSIINILHKKFQQDHTNSRFLGFPGGFLNSSRFPGVVDTLIMQTSRVAQIKLHHLTFLHVTKNESTKFNDFGT